MAVNEMRQHIDERLSDMPLSDGDIRSSYFLDDSLLSVSVAR